MALSLARSVLTGSGILAMAFSTAEVPAQEPQASPVDAIDMSLSPECRVPGSKLYTLAPLVAVRAALEEKRPVKVLALGPSSAGGFGLGSSSGFYPLRLEGEMEKFLSGVDVEMEQRR